MQKIQRRGSMAPVWAALIWATVCAMLALPASVHAQDDAFAQLSPAGQAIVIAVNQARANNGLGALGVNPLLNQAAQRHADDMVANYLYSHYGSDGSLVARRVARTGYSDSPWVSENWVASSSPDAAVAWWMGDYVHRVNILTARWVEIGVGIATRPSGEVVYVTVFSAGTGGQAVAASAESAPPPAPVPQIQSVPASGLSYTIQPGDTLLGVAVRYGMTWQELAGANGLGEFSVLQIGQVIHIPGSGEAVAAETTGVGGPVAAQKLTTGKPYTVQAGDTIFAIAARNGLTWQELAGMNGLSEHSLLNIGQVILLPDDKATAETATEPAASSVAAAPDVAPAPESVPQSAPAPVTLSASAPQASAASLSQTTAATSASADAAALYTVAEGDTIFGIAFQHGIDWQSLLALNGLTEQSLLQPGQVIRLR